MPPASILLVEDNQDDVLFLKRAMKKAGMDYPVYVAENGQVAIDYLQGAGKYADRHQFPLPRLVLLDLKLPYVQGLDVLKWIRAQPQLRTLIVIILTSSHVDADIHQAYRIGANSFLVKSASAEQLEKMVRRIDEYWFQLNRPPSQSEQHGPRP